MNHKQALTAFLRDFPEYVPADVDVICVEESGLVNDEITWSQLRFYWANRLTDIDMVETAIQALTVMDDLEIEPGKRVHESMFNKYVSLGGPCPPVSGIIAAGDWRQSWENLRMYWNMACDVELWKTTRQLPVVTKALEIIAKVQAEFFGVPKLPGAI